MPIYYAACTLGLEQVLAAELRALGAGDITVRRGACAFAGDQALGYRACLCLRSAIRVQEELARGRVADRDDLYALASTVDWSQSITHLQTIAIDGSVKDSFANDTRFPVLVVKDAICDQFRDRTGKRPDVARDRPDLPLKLVLQGTEAMLYRELGGEPLHKRGYREVQHKSPLNEATAAGLLLLTDWDRQSPVCDPMCGSATFLVEAAWLATDRAPGLGRSFAFEHWRDADLDAWRRIYDEAEARAAAGADRLPRLMGNDRHPGALAIARQAIAAAGLGGRIQLTHGDARDYAPPFPPGLVVTNPPYGQRIEVDEAQLEDSWRSLGQFLHERCGGASAYVLCGNPELTRFLGLRAGSKHPVRNGPIECRWLRYQIDAV
ncbi:MAG TPA: THUMP domain-containing protein [Planctomycetota bacterium]|nr:THUMP domain-containing protein [Planctomycetota bacterium]